MKRIAIVVLLATIGWSQTPADNAELKQIYEADQSDRTVSGDKVDWFQVANRDMARRQRVRELMEQDKLVTGKDYEHAAMVFQHGVSADDFLLAHVLAVTAIGKGALSARWLATATLDRYLQRIGQPQIFGTQFLSHTENEKVSWTMDPYNRTLLSPKLLDANCVPDPEDQLEMLKAFEKGEEPKPPKKQPCKK